MGRLPNPSRVSPSCVKKLSPFGREVVRRAALGQSVQGIAAEMGIHRSTVARTLHSAPGREHLRKLLDRADRHAVSAALVTPMARLLQELNRR